MLTCRCQTRVKNFSADSIVEVELTFRCCELFAMLANSVTSLWTVWRADFEMGQCSSLALPALKSYSQELRVVSYIVRGIVKVRRKNQKNRIRAILILHAPYAGRQIDA